MKKIILAMLTIALVACNGGGDDGGGGPTTIIPNIDLTCLQADAAECDDSPTPSVGYVALLKVDCTNSPNFGDSDMYAQGAFDVVSCTASGCSVTISSFETPGASGSATTTIPTSDTSISIVAYFDSDNSGSDPDSGDPFICMDNVDISGSSANINGTWGTFP